MRSLSEYEHRREIELAQVRAAQMVREVGSRETQQFAD